MPINPTYPGVYIEEIPSGVHTITGVATSITAFVGRTVSGDVEVPLLINNWGEFKQNFGGLGAKFPLSYAVQDFYQNGGSQAVILRLYSKPDAGDGISKVTSGGLKLVAASPGAWGNNLQILIDTNNITDDVAARYGVAKADLFNLTVIYASPGQPTVTERQVNLTVKDSVRRADKILAQSSQYVRVPLKNDGTPDLPATPPSSITSPANFSTDGDNGKALIDNDYVGGDVTSKTSLYALENTNLFNLLCIPPDTQGGDTSAAVYQKALTYCQARRAMLIVDPPAAWGQNPNRAATNAVSGLASLGLSGDAARNAALYFPRVIESDPLQGGQPNTYVPCGIVAGIMARTDSTSGVWKASAGQAASLNGIQGLEAKFTDMENGTLNQLGINCLRTFPVVNSVVWGARTLRGADQLADEYKYVPVRRLALYLEESLYRGLQWAIFEPNDEPLWAQIRLNVGAFMQTLFRKGAFQGQTPRDAYLVKCDKETTTQNDINLGVVNVLVGFAPLKPAEFVMIQIQQLAGQIAV